MQHSIFRHQIIPLLLSPFFFLLFLTSYAARDPAAKQQQTPRSFIPAARILCGYPDADPAETLTPSRTVNILRTDTGKRHNQLRFLPNGRSGSLSLPCAVCILSVAMLPVCRQIRNICRFIIQYIHDQDGHKSPTSFITVQNIREP